MFGKKLDDGSFEWMKVGSHLDLTRTAYDEDSDKVSLCAYTLMLDEQLEVLDDFIG